MTITKNLEKRNASEPSGNGVSKGRYMVQLLFVVLGCYLFVLVVMFFVQKKLVYFPRAAVEATPTEVGLVFEDVYISTGDGVEINGWYVPAPATVSEPLVVIFCHGNGGNISHRLETLVLFHRLGLATFIFDYRGYGRSQGSTTEKGTYADALAAWDFVVREKHVPSERIIVWGRSLGGAVASWLALEEQPAACVLESTFTSVPDVGARAYPFLPVRLLSRFRYNTKKRVPGLRCPVLVVHSRTDEIVSWDLGRQVFEAAREPKQFLEIYGGHNDGFLTSGATYVDGVRDFLASYVRK